MVEMAHNFLLSSAFMLALMLIGQGVQMRKLVASLGLTAAEFVVLLIYMAPTFLLLVVPLCCMLSVFLTFMRMSGDRELVALKAGGVSVLQLLPSPMWFASFCCLLTMCFSLYGIAWGTEGFRSTIMHLAATKARLTIQPGVFNQEIAGLTLFAREVDHSTGELREVIIEDGSSPGEEMTILAPRALIDTDNESGSLVFRLWDGRSYVMDEKGPASVASFKYFEYRLDISRVFSSDGDNAELKPKEMSWTELERHLRNLDGNDDGRFANRVRIEIQKRWSLPVACLVFGLFAVPLACSFESSRKQVAVVLAMLTFLIYYSLYSAGITLSESGRLSPALAMWGPNALFFLLGVVGIIVTSREGAPDLSGMLRRLAPARLRGRKRKGAAA
jgi:lipopolysaccharide export system permease protein